MKLLKRILVFVVLLVLALGLFGYFYAQSTAPSYEGTRDMPGLKEEVKVTFDEVGIPHIEAQNDLDAYHALGYVHAQDRLFQMDMIRRLVSGRLSEFIGEKALDSDKYMLTLSFWKKAQDAYKKQMQNKNTHSVLLSRAYLAGVNQFMAEGNLPLEYKILGMPVESFSGVDMYATICYMALGFTAALEQEPLLTKIAQKLGPEYSIDFKLDSLTNAQLYHMDDPVVSVMKPFEDFMDAHSMPIWHGSNNWAISKERSKSGKALLANDTHINNSQPAVWYEAHMSYPGFNFFGYYLAGVPFPVVGHSEHHGWGLTIFPIDNLDLFKETINPKNENEYLYDGVYHKMKEDKYTIKVKGQDNQEFIVRSTGHGPIVSHVTESLKDHSVEPISMYWGLLDLDVTSVESIYQMTYAKNMEEFRSAVALNDVIGLNVVYADDKDNIAWWASGAIPVRDSSINSFLIMDGSTSKNVTKGYYPFDQNPSEVNPEIGFVHTANSAPHRVNGILYPGYYLPGVRNDRIHDLLLAKDKWDVKDMAAVMLDNTSDRDPKLVRILLDNLDKTKLNEDKTTQDVLGALASWNGSYNTNEVAPTIFNSLIYSTMKGLVEDEIGSRDFERIVSNYALRKRIDSFFRNPDSKWWDNINTKDVVETRSSVMTVAFNEAVQMLTAKSGADVSQWKWGNVHHVTHNHPIGSNKLMDRIFGFNVGPNPIGGGNEIINKQGNKYNAEGDAKVTDSPALRLLIDFNDPQNAKSCIPTGQSGNVMSPHYDDQAKMYGEGLFHTQYMNVNDIHNGQILLLKPKN